MAGPPVMQIPGSSTLNKIDDARMRAMASLERGIETLTTARHIVLDLFAITRDLSERVGKVEREISAMKRGTEHRG